MKETGAYGINSQGDLDCPESLLTAFDPQHGITKGAFSPRAKSHSECCKLQSEAIVGVPLNLEPPNGCYQWQEIKVGSPMVIEFELRSCVSSSSIKSDDKWCMVAHMPRSNMCGPVGKRKQIIGGDESAVEPAQNLSRYIHIALSVCRPCHGHLQESSIIHEIIELRHSSSIHGG